MLFERPIKDCIRRAVTTIHALVRYLNLSLSKPEQNLALDEALLEGANESGQGEVLRFWEPEEPFVVVGYGNRIEIEVNVEACENDRIPVLRRCSGGGTVFQQPGCLNYSLILCLDQSTSYHDVTHANRAIMSKNRDALQRLVSDQINVHGVTDLTVRDKKFAGNAQRRKQKAILFHGSLLLRADLDQISKYLRHPSSSPDYRAGRSHRDFLMNFPAQRVDVERVFRREWRSEEAFPDSELPRERFDRLMGTRYGCPAWHENRVVAQ